MKTPYEELEYLADYLPDDGESVIVSRRAGELVCEPMSRENYRDGIADAELYGRLVLANERLNGLSSGPFWMCFLVAFSVCVGFFELTEVGWRGWYLALAASATAVLVGSVWSTRRRRAFYLRDIRTMLDNQMRRRQMSRYLLVGAIRQHPELSTLLEELSRNRDGGMSG